MNPHDRIHTTDRQDLEQLHADGIEQRDGMKPTGLWWAIDDAWIDWAERECYGLGPNTFRLDVDASKLLVIGRDMTLDEFNVAFKSDLVGFSYGIAAGRTYSIDWKKVAAKYSGIEIPFYSWSHRMSLSWYYGWDIASGCLWSPAALRGWERIERSAVRRRHAEAI